jgi:hypothetical protein
LADDTGGAPAQTRVAVVDACVLFTAALRDTLLRAASTRLYQPRWSELILDEVRRNLVEQERMRADQAERLLGALRRAFPYAVVSGFEALIERMPNQEKDRHVVAAAVEAGAQAIVTYNVRDFPKPLLAALGIDVQTPDEFLAELFLRAPDTMVEVVRKQAADLRAPPMTPEQVLVTIGLHAPRFAALVREELLRS